MMIKNIKNHIVQEIKTMKDTDIVIYTLYLAAALSYVGFELGRMTARM